MNARPSTSTLFIALLAAFSAFAAVLANPDSASNDQYDEEALVELLDFIQEELDESEASPDDPPGDSTDATAPDNLAFDDQPTTSLNSQGVDPDVDGDQEPDDDDNDNIVTPPTTTPQDGSFPVTPEVPTSIGEEAPATTEPSSTSTSEPSTSSSVIVAPPTTSGNQPTTTQPAAPTPTTAAPTTAAPTTEAPTTTVFVPGPGFTGDISPYDYKVKTNFDPSTDLPSAAARDAYNDWWAVYNNPDDLWPRNPEILFAPEGANDTLSKGTYDYGRKGFFFLASITELLRTTGDPQALEELIYWSTKLKSNLKDHDGRGYAYFQYRNPPGDQLRLHTDTNYLDESLLGGSLAHTAWALHQNRDASAEAGELADFWMKYLDQNWVPKWRARSTYGTPEEYIPPAELGLENVTKWKSPHNPMHEDIATSYRGSLAKYSGPGVEHTLPVREFAHPYIASMYQYYVLGEYFAETGKKTYGSPNGQASGYQDEAKTRDRWWMQRTTARADGSREWWLRMTSSTAPLRTGGYSTHVSIYMNAFHWEGFGNFADDANMTSYAKVWINPSAPNDDVYDLNDMRKMKKFVDASGNDGFRLMFHSLLIPWEPSGQLRQLTEQTTISTSGHYMDGGSGSTHGSHYNGIIGAELVKSLTN